MAKNLEIKARVSDFAALSARAAAIADVPETIIVQEDTFFPASRGRLKLRDFGDGTAELISYFRPDEQGPKTSEYYIAKTLEPEALKRVLAEAYGVQCVVRKVRTLYLVGQTRIHLDRVDQLGDFMELEYVFREHESLSEAEATVGNLMRQLEIPDEHRIAGAYADLLKKVSG